MDIIFNKTVVFASLIISKQLILSLLCTVWFGNILKTLISKQTDPKHNNINRE